MTDARHPGILPRGRLTEGVYGPLLTILIVLLVAVPVASASVGAQIRPSLGHFVQSPPGLEAESPAQNQSQAHLHHSIRADSQPPPQAVGFTLVPQNNSLIQGNYRPPTPGQITGAAYDPVSGQVFIGDTQGYSIWGVNGSSGRLQQAVSVGAGDPEAITVLTRPDRIVAADAASGALSVIDPLNGTLLFKFHEGDSPFSMALDPNNNTLYVANFGAGTVLGFNASTYQLTTNLTIRAPTYPGDVGGLRALAFDSRDNLLYVANYVYPSISVINTSDNEILASGIQLGGSSQPYCLAYDPRNNYVYVGNQISGNVSVLDGSTHTFVGSGVPVSGDCLSMVYDPANGNIYVANAGAGVAAVLGTSANGTGVYDPNTPAGLAYDSRDNRVYAANYGTNTVTAFNATTGGIVLADQPLSNTFLRATDDPTNGDIYVATPDPGFLCLTPGSLTVFSSGPRPHVVTSIPVGLGPEASVLDPRSGYLFVANFCSNNVTVVNTTTQKVAIAGIPVGTAPIALGYDAVHDRIIVANGASQNLTVLNGSSGAILAANVSVGPQPDGIAVDPANGWVYVADYGSGNLTILNGSTYSAAHANVAVGGCPEGVSFDPIGGLIVSINSCTGNLTILNGSSATPVRLSVPAGVGPVAATLDPTRNLLYVADAAGGSVTVVNLTTYAQVGLPIPVNGDPQGIAFDPTLVQVDVSDFLSGTISILATVPIVNSFLASPPLVAAQSVTTLFVSAAELGDPHLTISYTGLPPGCSSQDAYSILCRPTATGIYRVVANATDPLGYSGWSNLTLTVVSGLSADSLDIAPGRVDLGQDVVLTTTARGGIAPLTYSYSGLPAGCPSANSSTIFCSPVETGIFSVDVKVSDTQGRSADLGGILQVAPRPTVGSFVATPRVAVLGSTFALLGSIDGGTFPLSIRYIGLPPGCSSLNLSVLGCTPNATGTFDIQIAVTDAVGDTAGGETSLVVTTPPLSLASFFASPSMTPIGANFSLESFVEGGVPPYRYAYSGLPSGCATADSPQLVCRPSSPGRFNVSLTVTDLLNDSTATSTTVTVTPAFPGPQYSATNSGVWPSNSLGWALLGVGVLGGALAGCTVGLVVFRVRRQPP